MKFAVIGCGSIGLRHITNLLQMGHQVIAYNRGKSRRSIAEQRFGILTYACLDTMLDTNTIDAVIICTPNSIHKDNLASVVERSLHFFVEKPLATDLDGLDELEINIEKKGLISHVGTNMRFHFGPKKIKEYLDAGEIGRPLWANFWAGMYLPDWHPEENHRDMYSASKKLGGGAILDFIHEIDLIYWIFDEPDRLAAMAVNSDWLDIETEDIVDAIFGYKNGMQVNLHMDYLQRPFQRGIHIVGDKGSVRWDLTEESVQLINHDSQEKKILKYPRGYTKNDMYMAQMEYFIQCVQDKTISTSSFGTGRTALNIALNVKKSVVSNEFIKRRSI